MICKKCKLVVQKLADYRMLSKPNNTSQLGFFATLADQLDQKHSLFLLANRIEWAVFDSAFSKHYSFTQGKPAKPIRLMVSLLILKQLRI